MIESLHKLFLTALILIGPLALTVQVEPERLVAERVAELELRLGVLERSMDVCCETPGLPWGNAEDLEYVVRFRVLLEKLEERVAELEGR